MNRISVRGAAVATAMASTSVLVASGLTTASASDRAAADTLASGGRLVMIADAGTTWGSSLEAPPVVSPTAVRSHRASRSLHRRTLAPRDLGRVLAAQKGWRGEQWACLDKLWTRESEWKVTASNARSGAYGIPQSLPARKMAAFGADWRTNARTQIRWGLSYISSTYGSPCSAWQHSRRHGYY